MKLLVTLLIMTPTTPQALLKSKGTTIEELCTAHMATKCEFRKTNMGAWAAGAAWRNWELWGVPNSK